MLQHFGLREGQRFAGQLTRGRKVLAQLSPGRPLTDADFRYLHQAHGLPPELVTELLAERPTPRTPLPCRSSAVRWNPTAACGVFRYVCPVD